MNALVFLYKHVLKQPLSGEINADRALRKVKIPVVLTREETARVIALMSGVHQLIVKLLYGAGLRITECIRLRVQDVDLEMKALTVRNGKGDKDRITTFPEKLVQPLTEHLVGVKVVHGQDLKEGYGLEINRIPVRTPGINQASVTLPRHLRAAAAGEDVEIRAGVGLHDVIQVELQVTPL